MLFVSNEYALPRRLTDPSSCLNAERSSFPSSSLSPKLTSARHVSTAAVEESSIFTFDTFEADQERVLSHLLEDFYRRLDDRDVGGSSAKREKQKLASSGCTVGNARANRGESEQQKQSSFSFSTSAAGESDGRAAGNNKHRTTDTNPSVNNNAGLDPDTFVFNPYRPPRGAKYKEVLTMVNINEWALVRDACGLYEDDYYKAKTTNPIASKGQQSKKKGEEGTACTSSAALRMDSSNTTFIHIESEHESLQRRAAYDNYTRRSDHHRVVSNSDHTSTCMSGDSTTTRKKKRDGGDATNGFALSDASKQIAGIKDIEVTNEEFVDAILGELMKLDESDCSEEDDDRNSDENKNICSECDGEVIRNDAAASASEVVDVAVREGGKAEGEKSLPTTKPSAPPPFNTHVPTRKNEPPAVDPLELLRKAHRFGAPHRYGGVKVNADGHDNDEATTGQQVPEVSQRGRVGIPIVFSPEPICSEVRVAERASTDENGGAKTKEAGNQQKKLTKGKKNDAPEGVVVVGGTLEVVAVRKTPKAVAASPSLPPSSKAKKSSRARSSLTGENWDGSEAFAAFLRTKESRDKKESVGKVPAKQIANGEGRREEGSLPTLKAPTRTRVRFDEDATDRMNREVLQRALKAFGGQEKRGKELLHVAEGLNWVEAPATTMGKLPNLHVHAAKKTNGDTSLQGDAKRHTKNRVAPQESMASVGTPESGAKSAPLLPVSTGSSQDTGFLLKGRSRKREEKVPSLGLLDDKSIEGSGASLIQTRSMEEGILRVVDDKQVPLSVSGGGRARGGVPSITNYRGRGRFLAPITATRSPTYRPNGKVETDHPEQKLSFVSRGGTDKLTRLPHPPPPVNSSGPEGTINSTAGRGTSLLPLFFDNLAPRAMTVDATKHRAQVLLNTPSETCSPNAPIVRSAPAGGSAVEVSNQRRVAPIRSPLPPLATKAKANKGQRGV